MTAAVYRLSSLHHKPNKCLQKRLSNLGSIVQVLWKQHKSLTTLNRSYSRGQMSLGQFQESFLIGAFYSCHHYYYPGSTLTPHPPPPHPLLTPGSVGKLLANIDTCFFLVNVCSTLPVQHYFREGENWSEFCLYHVHCPTLPACIVVVMQSNTMLHELKRFSKASWNWIFGLFFS